MIATAITIREVTETDQAEATTKKMGVHNVVHLRAETTVMDHLQDQVHEDIHVVRIRMEIEMTGCHQAESTPEMKTLRRRMVVGEVGE